MKRKVMATLIAAGMAVAVTACGGSGTTSTADTSADAAQEEDAADAAADVAADAKNDQIETCTAAGYDAIVFQ